VVLALVSGLLGLCGGLGGSLLMDMVRRQRAKREEPILSIQPTREALYPAEVQEKPCAYARVHVCNDPERNAATGVGVYIEHVSGGSEDDKEKLAFLEGRWLAWANADRGDANVPPAMKTIRKKDWIDLAHLNSGLPGKAIVDVRPQPSTESTVNRLGPGTFTFELVVDVHNASPRHFKVDLVHDGETWDGKYESAADRLQIGAVRTNDEPGS